MCGDIVGVDDNVIQIYIGKKRWVTYEIKKVGAINLMFSD